MKAALVFICLIILAIVVGYFVFLTPNFQIKEVSIVGLETIDRSEVEILIKNFMSDRIFNLANYTVAYGSNILIFKSEIIRKELLARFPVFKNIEVRKEYFDKIKIVFSERKPIGIWCFENDCRYFDDEGRLWGNSVKSSGPLLLSINDLRILEDDSVDTDLVAKIKEIINESDKIGLKIISVTIPTDFPISSLKIYTDHNYYLILDSKSNVKSSINILRIFLEDRGDDFSAEYIDLRVEGRVYYK